MQRQLKCHEPRTRDRFQSSHTLHPAPVNEINLLICPIRDPPAAAVVAAQAVVAGATVPPDIANCNAAFFTEAATGAEADIATGAVRRLILALLRDMPLALLQREGHEDARDGARGA